MTFRCARYCWVSPAMNQDGHRGLTRAAAVEPMLAKAQAKVPDRRAWWYKPKWDGFLH